MDTIVAPAVPRPIPVGAEMAALARFYPDVTWSGRIVEGGMGPGTPAMRAEGYGRHELIQDGRWIVGTYAQDQTLEDGTPVLTWQLHWVVGWDPAGQTYRATLADNYGHAEVMGGRIEGDRLVFDTVGAPVPLRMTWDASDAAAITWLNELRTPDGQWQLIETYRMTPTGSSACCSADVVHPVARPRSKRWSTCSCTACSTRPPA